MVLGDTLYSPGKPKSLPTIDTLGGAMRLQAEKHWVRALSPEIKATLVLRFDWRTEVTLGELEEPVCGDTSGQSPLSKPSATVMEAYRSSFSTCLVTSVGTISRSEISGPSRWKVLGL